MVEQKLRKTVNFSEKDVKLVEELVAKREGLEFVTFSAKVKSLIKEAAKSEGIMKFLYTLCFSKFKNFHNIRLGYVG